RMERSLAEHQQRIDWLAARLIHPADKIRQRSADLQALGRRLRQALGRQGETGRLRLDSLRQRLSAARPRPEKLGEGLSHLHFRLNNRVFWQISQQAAKLNTLERSLNQLDPTAVLARGYALAIGPDGRVVRDAATLTPGDTLKLDFARGSAQATVNQVVADPEAD
ncbi:MAG TPA: exodeoxyribonuclease VII large subunit, partial [Azonexus sp.]|nr:exodeoxyribonuclease VII large subunit [Azonexus sp.]